ncbi:MAG TPA: hypothetical protein EYG66_02315 [Mariprofundaceae bacterium]|nr:hypothetical protein [Mariprofundaceae bacterium]
MRKFILTLSLLLFPPFQASGKVLPGLVDQFGNPVRSADEFNIMVQATVDVVPQGFLYSYSLTNDPASSQAIWNYKIFFRDMYSFIPSTD